MAWLAAAARLVGAEAVRLVSDRDHRSKRAEAVSSAAGALRSARVMLKGDRSGEEIPPADPSQAVLERLAMMPTRDELARVVVVLQRDAARRSSRLTWLIAAAVAVNILTLAVVLAR